MWTLTNLRPSPRSNWNLEVLVFVEGEKPENPEKNPQSKARTNNKLNPHETASTGMELGSQRWEASAYPLRHPCSPPPVLPKLNTKTTIHLRLVNIDELLNKRKLTFSCGGLSATVVLLHDLTFPASPCK